MVESVNEMDPDALRDAIVRALDDAKAQNIHVMDVRGLTDISDYMIVATGTSTRHTASVADKVGDALRGRGRRPIGVEGQDSGDWVLIDYGDVIVHVMLPETRALYQLEKLWSRLGERESGEGSQV